MSGHVPSHDAPVHVQPHEARHGEAEPHHVPHGYVHPEEHHRWIWYAGWAVGVTAIAAVVFVYWQIEHSQAPLCSAQIGDTFTSPSGNMDVGIMRVRCLGGAEQQKIVLHDLSGQGASQAVISFDETADIRIRWVSDDEIAVAKKSGKVLTFMPHWHGVHIKYL